MNLVAFSFHIEYQRPGLSLHVANKIIVVVELVLGLEEDFDRDLRLSGYHTRNRIHSEGVAKVRASFDALLGEAEAEGNVLLVDERHDLSVLS
jgi:hypothetical protein